MTDRSSGTDWSKVNHAIQKRRSETDLPLHPDRPLELPGSLKTGSASGTGDAAPAAVANPEGILTRFKVGAITRKAAVAHAQEWHARQLEVVRHRLGEIVRVRNAEATTIAEQMLASINAQHLGFLTELGLRDEGDRKRALMLLTDQTSEFLRDAMDRDWPDSLRQQYIDGVIARHNAFFDKLASELGA